MRTAGFLILAAATAVSATPIIGDLIPRTEWTSQPEAPQTQPGTSGVVCQGIAFLNVASCNDIKIPINLDLLSKRTGGGSSHPSEEQTPDAVDGVVCKGVAFLNVLSCNDVNVPINLSILDKRTGTQQKPDPSFNGVICKGTVFANIASCDDIDIPVNIGIGKKEKRTDGHESGDPNPTPAASGVMCNGAVFLNVLSCNDVDIPINLNILDKKTNNHGEEPEPAPQINPAPPADGVICKGVVFINVLSCNDVNIPINIDILREKRSIGL